MGAHQYVMVIIPKFTAALSITGSTMIISQIVRNKPNRRNVQQRILLMLSIIDVAVSTVWFLSNFFMPPYSSEEFIWQFGNQTTCSIQGYIVQFSIAGVMYNSTLSLYYMLKVKYNITERQLGRIEYAMHLFPLLFGFITATTSLFLELYNPANWDCWISPYPQGESL